VNCRSRRCPECGDQLIHLNNRGDHEAASGLLQWIHDNVPRQMDVIDDDLQPDAFEVVRRKLNPPLWLRIEHKPRGKGLRPSQQFLLPRMANSIQHGIHMQVYHPMSGVYVVWSDPPYESGAVSRVWPQLPLRLGEERELKGAEWVNFWLAAWIDPI